MSGGSLSYFYLQLQEHIGDFGDKELDDLVSDLAALFYAREWYLSSDTCKDDWIEARDKFKDKWFTEYGRQERIKNYIEEIRSDVLDMFGIDDREYDTCKYWSYESDNREVFSTCNPVVKADEGREMNDDLISRQAVIDVIFSEPLYETGMKKKSAEEVAPAIFEKVKVLPSAEPERETGKWIDTDNYYMRWKCSLCGCHTRDAHPAFCPYCGAKMEDEG